MAWFGLPRPFPPFLSRPLFLLSPLASLALSPALEEVPPQHWRTREEGRLTKRGITLAGEKRRAKKLERLCVVTKHR